MKEYIKKVKGKGKKEQETKIENNLKGLYDYLTAPNIKKKPRNLIFFTMYFSKCLTLFIRPPADNVGKVGCSHPERKTLAGPYSRPSVF